MCFTFDGVFILYIVLFVNYYFHIFPSKSASMSDPPTANIKPTPVVSTPSKVTAAAMAGNKSTPRASIRPMVTPATVTNPTTTPTATVMPTTQVESQEGK